MMIEWRQFCIGIVFMIACGGGHALAQSAIEHHAWQEKRSFAPYSTTAEAITGRITLSGNPRFAVVGSKMSIAFGNGKTAQLSSVGAASQQWDDVNADKVTGEVFAVSKDPGTLKNGNTLCGSTAARYIVFMEKPSVTGSTSLGMAVFGSKIPPKDINSDGLCGTFNYIIQ